MWLVSARTQVLSDWPAAHGGEGVGIAGLCRLQKAIETWEVDGESISQAFGSAEARVRLDRVYEVWRQDDTATNLADELIWLSVVLWTKSQESETTAKRGGRATYIGIGLAHNLQSVGLGTVDGGLVAPFARLLVCDGDVSQSPSYPPLLSENADQEGQKDGGHRRGEEGHAEDHGVALRREERDGRPALLVAEDGIGQSRRLPS